MRRKVRDRFQARLSADALLAARVGRSAGGFLLAMSNDADKARRIYGRPAPPIGDLVDSLEALWRRPPADREDWSAWHLRLAIDEAVEELRFGLGLRCYDLAPLPDAPSLSYGLLLVSTAWPAVWERLRALDLGAAGVARLIYFLDRVA